MTAIKGAEARPLSAWTARATRSLPLPDGPVMRTEVVPGATRRTSDRRFAIVALLPSKRVSAVAAQSCAGIQGAVMSVLAPLA